MVLLLNIDTATEIALISLSENERIIEFAVNNDQKEHASFLHPAIKELLQKSGRTITELAAIAVTCGPGSYTGLRVGMAAAKGLCFALNIPLITINTLEVMALSSYKQTGDENALYCPMIDARRMEVFTAVYDHVFTTMIKPCAMLLNNGSFDELLSTNKIYFSGSGASKLKSLLANENAVITDHQVVPHSMAILANENYIKQNFANIAYASPLYLKEYYTPPKREV